MTRTRRSSGPLGLLARIVSAIGSVLVLLAVLSVVQVFAARWITPPITLTMLGQVVESGREGDLRWVDYEPRPWSMDHPVARAAVSSEDARFFLHGGFDWDAICVAVEEARDGGRLRGASTISQQVARNVFLWQGRSWVRKGVEVWYTAWLELLVPKERILELYLNVAETGPMTFGFEAGARHWYGRPADELSQNQAARLAGILPAPRSWSPTGKTASERVRFIRSNPAPFPRDPGFEHAVAAWAETRGPVDCLLGSD